MPRDVTQVIEDVGMGTYQFVQLLLIGGVMIADGAEILLSSSLLSALKTLWNLTPLMRGAMMSTIFIGVFLGGLLGGRIADSHGRRMGILVSYTGLIIFGTGTAAAQGPISMLVMRFLFGASFGCGMGPGMAMQVETAPSNWRAHIVNLGGLWFSIGEIYTAVLLVIFMPTLTDPDGSHWRWVTVLSMVPGLLLFPFTYFLLQETPSFLSSQGRKDEAIRSLQYIATMNGEASKTANLDSDDPDLQLVCAEVPEAEDSAAQSSDSGQASSLLENSASSGGDAHDVQLSDAPQQRQSAVLETASILFSSEYRSIVIGGCYMCFLANFLFYGLTYALPQIFSKLGHELEPAVQVLIISICDMPGVLLAFFLIYSKHIGHRDGLVILATAAAVFSITLVSIDHGLEGLYIGLPSAYLVKYVASAFFTLSYVYLAEVFPSKVRASGVSLCIAAGRLGSILSPIIVELLHVKGFKLGEHAPFLMTTAVLCILAIAVIKLTLHFELKNAPLQERLPGQQSDSRRPSKATLMEGSAMKKTSKAALDPDKPPPAG